MKSETNHQPWDNGAIGAAFESVFGVGVRQVIQQKTIKARCGKRVPVMNAVIGQAITCGACCDDIEREKEFILEMAVAMDNKPIIFAIAERTIKRALDHLRNDPAAQIGPECEELLLCAQEAVIADQLAFRGI